MKKSLCDVCGCTVVSMAQLHRLKRTTPASWNGFTYLQTCTDCASILDDNRSSIVQSLRETYARKQRASQRRKKAIRVQPSRKKPVALQKSL